MSMQSQLTYSIDTVSQYIFKLMQDNIFQLRCSVGPDNYDVKDIWYSDQEMIPHTPAVIVEPGVVDRVDEGPTLNTVNEFEVYVIVYADVAIVGSSNVPKAEQGRRVADLILEACAQVLHSDITLGGADQGLVTYGFFHQMQAGYAVRGGKLLRAARGQWRGKNKTRLV